MTLPAGHLDMSLYEIAQNMFDSMHPWTANPSIEEVLKTGLLVWTHEYRAFQVCLTYNKYHCEEHGYYSVMLSFVDGTCISQEADEWGHFSTLLTPFDLSKFLWLSYEDLHAQREAVEKHYQTAEQN